jgi:calcineurin-like phosphoesterase family protein
MANINKGTPMIWFSADKHLFHEFMLRGVPPKNPPVRPMFSTVEEMNETIVARHNEVVKKGDLVYELGDMFLKCDVEAARQMKRRMTGNFYYILGNHEAVTENLTEEFVWMRNLERIRPRAFAAPHITLCHYAMRTWNGSHKGTWQLYGHSHGQLPERPELLSFDVGVDCWNFYPISIEQVIKKMTAKIPAWEAWKQRVGRYVGI